jgi:predicted hotdog family 3-hydroxylacyl-ACP dehydratase
MMMREENILAYIPQRPPFVMIDALIFADEKISRSVLSITEENIFVKDGMLTEPGLVENIAQTAAAGIGYICGMGDRPVPLGYIASIQNLEIFALPVVNESIETEVITERQILDVTVISGKIFCNNEVLAHCSMKIFIKNQT